MTTFGEIVEPVSRTAWEDWDDTLSEENNTKLQWINTVPAPDIIDTLLILEGKYLNDCITNQSENKLKQINCVKEVGMSMFMTEQSNKYICTIKDYNLLNSSEIVELLKPFITASSNVVTIQTKPLSEYQSFELTSQDCIIRVISTSKVLSELFTCYKKLEQPNIMYGVAAGVISLREHLNAAGTAVMCFVENPEDQIKEILELWKKLNIMPNFINKPNSVCNSNLYI